MKNSLKRIREALRLRRGYVAELTGRSEPVLALYEAGTEEIPEEVLTKLQQVYGVSKEELLSDGAPSLTKEEQTLLDNFRTLTEPDKNEVLALVRLKHEIYRKYAGGNAE